MPPAQPLWQAMAAGVVGGVLNAAVGHPFDTTKVRAQQCQSDDGASSGSPSRDKSDGAPFGGLFDGFLSQLVGVTPFWMVFYFGYRLGRRLQPDSGMLSLARAGAIAGQCVRTQRPRYASLNLCSDSVHKSSRRLGGFALMFS
eukprot:SAG11_NODE_130_length_15497_cov_10.780556_4_plen_143_part_00